MYVRENALRGIVAVVLFLLFAQFLLGMWLNLFAAFPTAPSSASSMLGAMGSMMGLGFSGGVPALMIHMMTGFLLLVLSVVVVALAAASSPRRSWVVALSGLGFVSVLAAGIAGLDFMVSSFQDNFYSYAMAISFVSAFSSYFLMLSFTRRQAT